MIGYIRIPVIYVVAGVTYDYLNHEYIIFLLSCFSCVDYDSDEKMLLATCARRRYRKLKWSFQRGMAIQVDKQATLKFKTVVKASVIDKNQLAVITTSAQLAASSAATSTANQEIEELKRKLVQYQNAASEFKQAGEQLRKQCDEQQHQLRSTYDEMKRLQQVVIDNGKQNGANEARK